MPTREALLHAIETGKINTDDIRLFTSAWTTYFMGLEVEGSITTIQETKMHLQPYFAQLQIPTQESCDESAEIAFAYREIAIAECLRDYMLYHHQDKLLLNYEGDDETSADRTEEIETLFRNYKEAQEEKARQAGAAAEATGEIEEARLKRLSSELRKKESRGTLSRHPSSTVVVALLRSEMDRQDSLSEINAKAKGFSIDEQGSDFWLALLHTNLSDTVERNKTMGLLHRIYSASEKDDSLQSILIMCDKLTALCKTKTKIISETLEFSLIDLLSNKKATNSGLARWASEVLINLDVEKSKDEVDQATYEITQYKHILDGTLQLTTYWKSFIELLKKQKTELMRSALPIDIEGIELTEELDTEVDTSLEALITMANGHLESVKEQSKIILTSLANLLPEELIPSQISLDRETLGAAPLSELN